MKFKHQLSTWLLATLCALALAGCASSGSATSAAALNATSYENLVEGKYSEGERQLRQALAAEPNNAWTLLNLGALLHRTGRFEQAYTTYKRVIEVDPNGEVYGRAAKASAPGFENRTAAELAQDNIDNLPAGIVPAK